MKTWRIPVVWSVFSVIEVEAETLEQAMEIAEDKEENIPLPTDLSYLDGSWELSSADADEIRHFYNKDQLDENSDETGGKTDGK